MRVLADENFPRPALESIAQSRLGCALDCRECSGLPDEGVASLCAEEQRILLTFDKDFGELIFRRGHTTLVGVVLFRITPESPEEAAELLLRLVGAGISLSGSFCVVSRERIRVRPLKGSSVG